MTDDTSWDPAQAGKAAADAEDGRDDEIEQKVADIEETRDELTATVEALGDRLAPANVIADAKQTVHDATVGRVKETVNDMTQTADRFLEDPAATAKQTGSGILDKIRENPLPAALVGVGVGWMLLKRDDRSRSLEFRPVYDDRSRGSWGEPNGAAGNLDRVTDRIGRGATDTADTLSQAAGQAADTVGRKVGQLGEAAGGVPMQAGTMTRSMIDQASGLVQSNPLGASIAALAVGAVVGTLIPTTRMEHEVMGQASERLIDGAGQAAQQGLRAVGSSSDSSPVSEDPAAGSQD